MNKIKPKYTSLTGIALLFLVSCSSLTIKDDETLRIATEKARDGNEKAYKAMETALEKDEPKDAPNIHEKILTELGTLSNEKSLEILRKYAKDRIPDRRSKAILALSRHSGIPKEEKNKEILETVKHNKEQFSTVLPAEIQALGNTGSIPTLEFLHKQFFEPNENKDLIVQATGTILSENLNGKDKTLIETAASNLYSFAEKAPNDNIRNLALQAIENAHGNNAMLKEIVLDSEKSIELRTAILGFLKPNIIEEEGTKYSDALTVLWKNSFKDEPKFADEIVNVLAEKRGISFEKMKQILKGSINKTRPDNRQKYIRKGTPEGILSLAEKYGIKRKTFYAFDTRIKKIMEDESIPLPPEKRVLSAALNRLKPGLNYFEKKKFASKGIYEPKVFSSLMHVIVFSGRTKAWQIMVIGLIGNIEQSEASKLRSFYLAERKTLNKL